MKKNLNYLICLDNWLSCKALVKNLVMLKKWSL